MPVFSFGEIEILKQVMPAQHPWLATFQFWFKKFTGIAPIIFFGKGIFGNYVGIMPRKFPLTVVGKYRYYMEIKVGNEVLF